MAPGNLNIYDGPLRMWRRRRDIVVQPAFRAEDYPEYLGEGPKTILSEIGLLPAARLSGRHLPRRTAGRG